MPAGTAVWHRRRLCCPAPDLLEGTAERQPELAKGRAASAVADVSEARLSGIAGRSVIRPSPIC